LALTFRRVVRRNSQGFRFYTMCFPVEMDEGLVLDDSVLYELFREGGWPPLAAVGEEPIRAAALYLLANPG
jgi:hypothetical protein